MCRPAIVSGAKVYYRLTDNWLELTVRFVYRSYSIRDLKDALGQGTIESFDNACFSIASATTEIVGFPALKVKMEDQAKA